MNKHGLNKKNDTVIGLDSGVILKTIQTEVSDLESLEELWVELSEENLKEI